jgi:type I restriction enzyme S subunit
MLPEGWKKCRLGTLISSLEAGVSVNSQDRKASPDEHGVLKISAVTSGIFDPAENKVIRADELGRAAVQPKADRIIVSRSNTETLVGASAYIDRDYPHLYLSDKLWQLKPNTSNPVHMHWLSYWLASASTRVKLSKHATGTSGSMKNISKE